jgi:sec-independent protein translocase protein TatC
MARKPNDDLFGGSTMTFGEHLEELRACLFRGVMGIAAGCLIGFFIANSVVRFFQSPLERAMERYYIDKEISDSTDLDVEHIRMTIDDGLISEPLQVEMGEAALALALNYPEHFGDARLTPYWFTEGDFLAGGPTVLVKQLAAAGQSKSASTARAIWELLTPDERKQIESLTKADGPLSRDQTSRLLTVLNSVAGRPELHAAPELAGLTGPDADPSIAARSSMAWVATLFGGGVLTKEDTVARLRQELSKDSDSQKSRRLNKLLIARVFPESLKKARIGLVTINVWRPVKVRFQVLNAQEAFMIWLKAALTTGLVIASPYLFYQIWIFVAAGLYPHEKNYVYLYLPISILLFLGGASLAFVFVFDPVLDFLFTFNKGMNADFDPRIGEWLGFVLILPLGFGISFQLPLVMLFINRIGLVSLETYINQWRVAILTIFVVAMVLTPADPISMLLMAGPLCFLYLLGILMCKYMPRSRSPFAEAYEP